MRKAINQERMRSLNKHQIFAVVKQAGPVSKKAIADTLGISLTTVSTFINELLDEEKLVPCGTSKSTGGRKSEVFTLNPNARYVIGVDIQVDRLVSVILNFTGDPLYTKTTLLTETDEWYVAALLKEQIAHCVDQADIPPGKLGAIGIGVPGIVDPGSSLIEFAPNLGWRSVNLAAMLALELPLVIENEANAAVLGEKTYGLGRVHSNIAFISIGSGIGTGLVLNNALYRGFANNSGEFGHMTVVPDGLPCRCGNRGCWEVYASDDAALKRFREQTGTPLVDFDALLQLAAAGDPVALGALEETARYLGIGLANIANALNPELIVLGGKLAQHQPLIRNRLLREVKGRALDRAFRGLTVDFSTLGVQATALGVAGLALQRVIAEPEP